MGWRLAKVTGPRRSALLASREDHCLLDVLWRASRGELDAASLAAIEDDAIRDAVARQEAIGLQGITDGEFRRDWWHLDFLSQLDGVVLALSLIHISEPTRPY
mgnify:CR=1 FL=1